MLFSCCSPLVAYAFHSLQYVKPGCGCLPLNSSLRMQWGEHSWHEVCSADSSVEQQRLALSPGYSNANCAEYLQLQGGDLTDACCSPGDSFEALVAAGTAPTECGWDCAHIWCGMATQPA